MKRVFPVLMMFVAGAVTAGAQQASRPTIANIADSALSQLEKELVPLAEAMPAHKYEFAPTAGEFKNVRTFALQMRHIATVNYEIGAGLLGEKVPVEVGSHENGADSINTRSTIVKYLKDSFTYAHGAVKTLNDQNATELIQQPWKDSRLGLANALVWHSYDHYGQAVVYLRLNGIVPPASR